MICVSHETAPNRCSNSSKVSVINSYGTALPSLNFSGSSISQRRQSLISGRPLDREPNFLFRQQSQGLLRQHHLASGPTLERKTSSEAPQSLPLRSFVAKPDDHHDGNTNHWRMPLQSCDGSYTNGPI